MCDHSGHKLVPFNQLIPSWLDVADITSRTCVLALPRGANSPAIDGSDCSVNSLDLLDLVDALMLV